MVNVAVIGIRGVDVIYSGYETFVKNLIIESSDSFYYILFCRKGYQKKEIQKKNFKTISTSTIKSKYGETVLYSFISHFISIFQDIDVILYLGVSNTPFIFLQKLLGRKILVNTDGIDWQRKRWSIFGKKYLQLCEILTVIFSDVIICDSKTVLRYYKEKYRPRNLVYIPYGAETTKISSKATLYRYKLTPNKYIYTTGRLTPENKIEDLILAFKKIRTGFKCVIIGESVYEDAYKSKLIDLIGADSRFILTGFLQSREYKEICSNAYLYIETKEVGGTHPSLLEAMSCGNCVIARNVNFHKEVLEKNGIYYETDLEQKIAYLLKNPKFVQKIGSNNRKIIKIKYQWSTIINSYENLFIAEA